MQSPPGKAPTTGTCAVNSPPPSCSGRMNTGSWNTEASVGENRSVWARPTYRPGPAAEKPCPVTVTASPEALRSVLRSRFTRGPALGAGASVVGGRGAPSVEEAGGRVVVGAGGCVVVVVGAGVVVGSAAANSTAVLVSWLRSGEPWATTV